MSSMLLLLVVGYVLVLVLVRWREPHMIYYPTKDLESTPARAGLAHEDVWLTTADGCRIHGWFVPATNPASPTILFLHGNAGNISHRLDKIALLHGLGAALLIIDYRGYGQSEGAPSEAGTYRDAEAAHDWLKARGQAPIVYGESLGAAVAVQLAVTQPVRGIILEEPFSSIAAVGQKMFPFLPVRWLVRNKYDTLSKISRLQAPLLILHSRDDEMFDLSHAEALLAAAPEPKRLVELRGSHNDAFLVSHALYRSALAEYLRLAHSPQP